MIRRRRNKKPQVYAFIDSQNLNLGTQKVGWKLDWKKFYQYLQQEYGVTKAFLFVGYIPEFEDMYHQMHDFGYLVVLKPTSDLTRVMPEKETVLDEHGKEVKEEKRPVKGNIDAEMVLWAMKELNNYQKGIIVSGDGDFYCLLEYLHEQGKLGKVLVPNAQFSNLFNRYKEYIARLDQQKHKLSYRSHR